MLAADGRTIIVALSSKPSGTSGSAWFATYDVASGRLEHVFGRFSLSKTPLAPNFYLAWTSRHANALVVVPSPGHNRHIAIVQLGRRIALPPSQGQTLLPPPAW